MGLLKQAFEKIMATYFQERRKRMMAWTGLFFWIFLLILSEHFVPDRTSWEVGKVSGQDVQADRYLTFVDEAGTLARQQGGTGKFPGYI